MAKPLKIGRSTILTVGGICLSLGFVLGLGLANSFWSDVTAAWVQAVGSIGAIAFGFLYIEHQAAAVRAASERQRDEDAEISRNAIRAMADFIEGRIRSVGRVLKEGIPPSYGDARMYFHSLKAEFTTASTFTEHLKHSSQSIVCFSRYVALMATALSELEELAQTMKAGNRDENKKILKSATENMALVVDALDQSREALETSLTAEAKTSGTKQIN